MAQEDVQDHLSHGDHLGGCSVLADPGTSHVSFVVKNADSQIKFYPNPTQDNIYIQFGAEINHTFQVAIVDLTGRSLLQTQVIGRPNAVLPIGHLKSGIYFLKIMGGKTITFKIVKH